MYSMCLCLCFVVVVVVVVHVAFRCESSSTSSGLPSTGTAQARLVGLICSGCIEFRVQVEHI